MEQLSRRQQINEKPPIMAINKKEWKKKMRGDSVKFLSHFWPKQWNKWSTRPSFNYVLLLYHLTFKKLVCISHSLSLLCSLSFSYTFTLYRSDEFFLFCLVVFFYSVKNISNNNPRSVVSFYYQSNISQIRLSSLIAYCFFMER